MKGKLISIREIIILFVIGLALLIVGANLDWQISSPLFPMAENPAWSIIAGVGSLITSMVAVFACVIMVIKPPKKMVLKVLSIIAGIATALGATWGNINNVIDMHKYAPITNGQWIEILLIVLCVLFDVFAAILAFFAAKRLDSQKLFNVSFIIFLIFVSAFFTQTIFKYLASRPRPRACFLDGYKPAKHGYRDWYQFNPFDCFNHEITDYYKSFFSGHVITSAILCALLPLCTKFSPKYENDRRLQIILFYTGLLYTLVIAAARVLGGAHWMSDVGFAIIAAAAIIFIIEWIIVKTPMKEVADEKQNN